MLKNAEKYRIYVAYRGIWKMIKVFPVCDIECIMPHYLSESL